MKKVIQFIIEIFLIFNCVIALVQIRISISILKNINDLSTMGDPFNKQMKYIFFLKLFSNVGLITGSIIFFLKKTKLSCSLIILSFILLAITSVCAFYVASSLTENNDYLKNLIFNLFFYLLPVIVLINPKIKNLYGWK